MRRAMLLLFTGLVLGVGLVGLVLFWVIDRRTSALVQQKADLLLQQRVAPQAPLPGGASTYLVCAHDATKPGRCDYTANGEADDVEINAAIQALSEHGGTVLLSDGLFTLAAPVRLRDNMTLRGQGAGTRLKVQDGTPINAIETRSGVEDVRNVIVEDLVVHGNSGNQTLQDNQYNQNGIAFTNLEGRPVISGLIRNVWVVATASHGILVVGRDVTVEGTRVSHAGLSCIRGDNGEAVRIVGNNVGGCGEMGIYFEGGATSVVVTNNTIWSAKLEGIRFVNGVYGIIISTNTIGQAAGEGIGRDGIRVGESGTAPVRSVTVAANYIRNYRGNGISIDSASDILLSENVVDGSDSETTKGTHGIDIGGQAKDITLVGNRVSGNKESEIQTRSTSSQRITIVANNVSSEGHVRDIAINNASVTAFANRQDWTPNLVQPNDQAVTGTTQQKVLGSFTIPSYALSRSGGLRLSVVGTVAGTKGQKEIKLMVGQTPVSTIAVPADSGATWGFQAVIHGEQADGGQRIVIAPFLGSAQEHQCVSLRLPWTTDLTVSVVGRLENPEDVVTQRLFIVEPLIQQ